MTLATTVKKAARAAGAAVGLLETADPHKEERAKLRTPDDLTRAEAAQRKANAELTVARREVESGQKWVNYDKQFVVAADRAAALVEGCKRDLQRRRELAPQELQDARREAKRTIVESTTAIREIEGQLPDLAVALRDAKEAIKGREAEVAKATDERDRRTCESDLRSARATLSGLEADQRALAKRLGEAKDRKAEAEAEYERIDLQMLAV